MRVGQRVFHAKFGEGVIVTLEGGGADARGIAHEHNTYGALRARIEALEAGLLEACDLAETVCAEVTAYTDRGNPRIIDDDEARGEIARLRALVRP